MRMWFACKKIVKRNLFVFCHKATKKKALCFCVFVEARTSRYKRDLRIRYGFKYTVYSRT